MYLMVTVLSKMLYFPTSTYIIKRPYNPSIFTLPRLIGDQSFCQSEVLWAG